MSIISTLKFFIYCKMAKYTTHSDRELILLIKSGNESAFANFFNQYKGILFLQAFKLLKDDEEARDMVQDMFIKIWETRTELTVPESVEAYLHKSIRHSFIDYIRRKKTSTRYLDSLGAYLEEGTKGLDEGYIEKETIALFHQVLNSLPPKMREVFELSRHEGLSHKEIAEKLNISQSTVKKQIYYALKIMRLKINLHLFFLLFL
jgi:RNA polymerase sigma-70 factor (family 1)